jgi:hypothetical protein
VQLRDQLAKVFCFVSSEKKTFAYCRISEVFAYLSAFEAEPLAFLGSVILKVDWYKTRRSQSRKAKAPHASELAAALFVSLSSKESWRA